MIVYIQHSHLSYHQDVFFYKGQNRDGLILKRTISRKCGLEVESEQIVTR
jgi:hypothetical protein